MRVTAAMLVVSLKTLLTLTGGRTIADGEERGNIERSERSRLHHRYGNVIQLLFQADVDVRSNKFPSEICLITTLIEFSLIMRRRRSHPVLMPPNQRRCWFWSCN